MPDSDAENEIRSLMEEWTKAFVDKDVDGIMAFYADGDDFSAFDLMPPIEFHGGDMWRQNWVNFMGAFEGDFQMESAGTQIHAADDVAFLRSLVHQTGKIGGHDVDLWTRQTICFRKLDGKWKMVHDHASVPIDLATGKAHTDLSPSNPG